MIAAQVLARQETTTKQQEEFKEKQMNASKPLVPRLIPMKSWVLPKGHMGRTGIKMPKLLGVTIHDTGNTNKGSNALANCRYVHRDCINKKLSFHLCVDDKQAVILVPLDETAYHGSNRIANTQTIGIEICVASDMDLMKSHDNTAMLTAWILKNIMKIPIGTDISKYLFTHRYWIERSGNKQSKICPYQMLVRNNPYSWSTFVRKVNSFFIGR